MSASASAPAAAIAAVAAPPAAPAAPAPTATDADKPAPAEMKPEASEPKEKLVDANGIPIPTNQIFGGSRRTVDELLSGDYTIRPSTKKLPGGETVFYDGEVNIIVQFRSDRAVGVSIVAPTDPTPKPIGPEQYRSLMRLVGQAAKDSDIRKDATGILEFTVGDKP